MCGIVGAFAFTQAGLGSLPGIVAANEELQKRGPDGGGTYLKNHVALGHRRLSIIDISCAGDQPMHSADGRYTIVFNGEIFNYKNLQAKYLSTKEQQTLRSHSDTEVFLALYSKLKEKTFELLEGFFAAAIQDHVCNELVLVRDRYGKKPLIYYIDEDKLLFASELKALFQAGIPKEINWDLLPLYFQLNYLPQPYSIIKGVKKVKPGHYITISQKGVSEHSYYTLKTRKELYDRYNYEEAKKKLIDLMDEAVKKRLVSDVPLGAFLSGGIDSSVVVAFASKYTSKLKTFSIGYKDNPYFDETAYANLVAKKYRTEHTVFSLTNDDFLEHLTSILDYIDEPFADSSSIPVFILSYYTQKHVTVALSGDGGDEVFAGYNKHGAEYRIRQGGWKNDIVSAAAPLWSVLPHSRNNKLTNKFRQLHRFAEGTKMNHAERYWRWAIFNNLKKSVSLLHPEIKNKINLSIVDQIRQQFSSAIDGTDYNEILLADMNLVLLSDMLVKVDMMSMANSLEIRSPFLDHKIVDFAFSLPAEYKINGGIKKRIVQDAFRSLLPEELYNRPKKGFEIPLLKWLKKELWDLIDKDLLADEFVLRQRVFDINHIKDLKKQLHSNSPGDAPATIWALIVFQYWWKRYITD